MSENLRKHDQDNECDEAEDEVEDEDNSNETSKDDCGKFSRQEVHECYKEKEAFGQSANKIDSEVPNQSKNKNNEATEEENNANTANDFSKRVLAYTSKDC